MSRQRERHFRKNLGFGDGSGFKFSLLYLLVVWPELYLDPVGSDRMDVERMSVWKSER